MGALVERGGARMVVDKARFFAMVQGVEFVAVDGGHEIVLVLKLRSFTHPYRMRSG